MAHVDTQHPNTPSDDPAQAIVGVIPWLIPLAGGILGAVLAYWALRVFSVVWMGLLGSILAGIATPTEAAAVGAVGATLFAVVMRQLGGDEFITSSLKGLPFGPYGVLAVVMFVIFVLGFFVDFFEICFIHVPILTPVLVTHFGFDPVWLGIVIGINLQTSFLTPPFGFALFYLRGVAPPEITTPEIYRGAVPFVALQLVGLALVIAYPQLSSFLIRLLR